VLIILIYLAKAEIPYSETQIIIESREKIDLEFIIIFIVLQGLGLFACSDSELIF